MKRACSRVLLTATGAPLPFSFSAPVLAFSSCERACPAPSALTKFPSRLRPLKENKQIKITVKLTKTEKKVVCDKKFGSLLDDYNKVLIAAADNVGSNQLQNIRKGLRGDSVVLMGKSTLICRCNKIHAEKIGNKNYLNLRPLLGNVGLIFTKGDLKEVSEEVAKYKTFTTIASSNPSYTPVKLGSHFSAFGRFTFLFHNISHQASILRQNIYSRGILDSFGQIRHISDSVAVLENVSLTNANDLASDDDSTAKAAITIQGILDSHEDSSDLSSALVKCNVKLSEDLVVLVLRRYRSDWKLALSFFDWATAQNGYMHESRAYNEILDVLGRMKQIKLMRKTFDEIPKDRLVFIINDKTFAILMNRYAGAHRVQEAIDIFYKRIDYGFELDMIGFQTLLMSLCRYKHVEEAEALFLQKQDEFPPVIKSRNIILNGWCVLGSLRDAKRFWNDIISSGCKPDLFTYGIFINSLTKAGKLGSAVKLFTSMWEKGCNPDVTICNCIIDALCFKKEIPHALEIFSEMNERGCLPDVATYNSLIKHLCKIRRMQKVGELLNEMEQNGFPPNARTYSYILKTMESHEEVNTLLQRMERTGTRIDADTYNLILNLYLSWKYQKGVRFIWDEMKRSGLGPDQRSYTVMVHKLHSQGKLDEALQFYNEMRMKGMIPEARTRLLVKAIYVQRGKVDDF